MNKLINLPSGSGKTFAYRDLASQGYAVIDLDAFVFKSSNGYRYHPDTYGYLKSLRNVTCVGCLTNDKLLECFDKVIVLDKDQINVDDDIYLNTIHRNYVKGFPLNAAFFNKNPNIPTAYKLILNEATKGNRVNTDFPSMVNLQLHYAWKHRHHTTYRWSVFDSKCSEEAIDFRDGREGFIITSQVGSFFVNIAYIDYASPSSMVYASTPENDPEIKAKGLTFIQFDGVSLRDTYLLEKKGILTFYDCQYTDESKLLSEVSDSTMTLIKSRFLLMDTWFRS